MTTKCMIQSAHKHGYVHVCVVDCKYGCGSVLMWHCGAYDTLTYDRMSCMCLHEHTHAFIFMATQCVQPLVHKYALSSHKVYFLQFFMFFTHKVVLTLSHVVRLIHATILLWVIDYLGICQASTEDVCKCGSLRKSHLFSPSEYSNFTQHSVCLFSS